MFYHTERIGMFNTRDSETPYIPPSGKPFRQQIEEWLEWEKKNPEKGLKHWLEYFKKKKSE